MRALSQVPCLDRHCPGEQLVEHDAEAVDICSGINDGVGGAGLLGAHVFGCADDRPNFGEGPRGCVGQARLKHLGDAEIDHLHRGAVPLVGDEDIRGLQVAMDHAALMRMLHRLADLHEKLEALIDRRARRVGVSRDRRADHMLHGEERATVGREPCIEHLGDVLVTENGQHLALDVESRQRSRSRPRLSSLSATFRRMGTLVGQPDRAHAAFAEQTDEHVRADVQARRLESIRLRRIIAHRSRCRRARVPSDTWGMRSQAPILAQSRHRSAGTERRGAYPSSWVRGSQRPRRPAQLVIHVAGSTDLSIVAVRVDGVALNPEADMGAILASCPSIL